MPLPRVCKDCVSEGITTERPAPFPGPRCSTHNRAIKKRRKARAHERRLDSVYGITADEYRLIYEYQGGRCAICQRATGARKALAVDHDHKLCGDAHPSDRGCPRCIRGLACVTCNYIILGRYDVAALQRAIDYLRDPPAKAVLRSR